MYPEPTDEDVVLLSDDEVNTHLALMAKHEVSSILVQSKLGSSLFAKKFNEGRSFCRICKTKFTERSTIEKIKHMKRHFSDDFRATEKEIDGYLE